ncbi:unnamed protein product [Schistosoma mattheei]|uniref:Uncharacterized protein n=1 Tax=Schistosoma mattheei TaxID=31246 RepID=A0A183PEP2_9TREM|nr:unnamed protein product [Schistosoma mattheei]
MDISELAKVTRQLMTRTVAPVDCGKQEINSVEKIEELEREIAAIRVNHKRNDKCYAYGGTGHWNINCPTRRRRRYFRRYNMCSFYPRNLGVVALVDRGAVYMRVNINERGLVCLIDTGAAVSLIGKEQCKRLKPCTLAVHTIGGVSKSVVKVGDDEINFPFVVTTSLSRPILGADLLREERAIVDLRNAIAHTGPVLGLKFSSDGLHLISWGGSGLTVNAASLRLWTSGPGDCEQSSHIPRLRPVNFGNIILNSESNQISDAGNQTFTSSNSSGSGNQSPQSSVLPIRLDTTHMSIGDLWGASSLCIFVPVRNRLLIASASKHNTSTKIITRHFSKVGFLNYANCFSFIRACVWNDRRLELYTCGADGNLFTWPILPLSSSNVIDDDQF